MNWLDAAHQLDKQGQAYILITLVGVSGSTPRDSGTKMVVSLDKSYDTIGGGHLEYKAIATAQLLLLENKKQQKLEHFKLGSNLGQCCGGTANVLFECFAQANLNIMLFGAGHVGKAVATILSGLPCKVSWVDSRIEQFPRAYQNLSGTTVGNITTLVSDDPVGEIKEMPPNSYFIVMTHNHQLDFELCQAVMAREDFHYLGLIASDTKWRRFQQRFEHRDIPSTLVERINCPIGLSQVSGKQPMEVAVSIAAEIIALYQLQKNQQKTSTRLSDKKGINWRELKSLLVIDHAETANETTHNQQAISHAKRQ